MTLRTGMRRTAGLGKPEPLRHEWSGYWSRRITKEHRLVYRLEADVVYIAQCRFHYQELSACPEMLI